MAKKYKNNMEDAVLNHPLLGKVPDHVIASQLNLSQPTVQRHRCRNKIPSFRSWRHGPPEDQERIRTLIKSHPLLGKITDAALAEDVGTYQTNVFRIRKKLGIKGYRETQREQKRRANE
jgi:hypothetical protein